MAPVDNTPVVVSRWRPAPSPGGLIGALAAVLCAVVAGAAGAALVGWVDVAWPVGLLVAGLVIFLALAVVFGYLVYAYFTIGYELDARGLAIRWGRRRWLVDLGAVRHIGPAIGALDEQPGRWQPFWPGYYVGVRHAAQGPVRVVATLPLRRQLLIVTDTERFAISPERPVLFVEEYGRLRRALDAERSGSFPTVQPGEAAARLAEAGWTMQYPTISTARPRQTSGASTTPAGPAAESARSRGRFGRPQSALLSDNVCLGFLLAGVLLAVLMIVYTLTQYESLPRSIVLHWNAAGNPDRVGSPREIWVLPVISVLVMLANFGLAWSVVSFDRFAARLLLASTCLVQVVAWIALFTLIS